MGSMYAAVLFIGITNATSVQPVVYVERFVSYRERAAGMYSALPFAFAQARFSPYSLCSHIFFSKTKSYHLMYSNLIVQLICIFFKILLDVLFEHYKNIKTSFTVKHVFAGCSGVPVRFGSVTYLQQHLLLHGIFRVECMQVHLVHIFHVLHIDVFHILRNDEYLRYAQSQRCCYRLCPILHALESLQRLHGSLHGNNLWRH